MSKSNAQKYRDLSQEELTATLQDERKELFKLVTAQKQTKKFEKAHLIRQSRRNIARMLTIDSEKQSSNRI